MARRRPPRNVTELAAELTALAGLPPVERARRARELERPARALIADLGDEAVYEATRTMTHAEVAKLLGVTQSRINNAVTAHRARVNRAP